MRQRMIESKAGSIPGVDQAIMVTSTIGAFGILQRPSPRASECVVAGDHA